MKNLAIGFASLRPHTLQEDICDIREREYFLLLKLKSVLFSNRLIYERVVDMVETT